MPTEQATRRFGPPLLAMSLSLLLPGGTLRAQPATPPVDTQPSALSVRKIAAITTIYHHNSHADMFVSRLLQTDTLDGKGRTPPLQVTSLYVDQFDDRDISRGLAAEHGVPMYGSVTEALTLGTGKLAVDGVLLIAEHGKYPLSATGAIEYPKRRLFEQVIQVFEQSGRVVPVFIDKHVSDNWADAKWIYDTAQKMQIPLMGGSSLPVLWRYPPVDVPRGAKLEQIVAVSYHTLTAYGFHALEMVQTLAERRQGGETGVRSVQCLTGQAMWEAGEKGLYDPALLEAALGRLRTPRWGQRTLREAANKDPSLVIVEYNDGLRACILSLTGAIVEWSVAWRTADGQTDSTLFWTQEARPFMHFSYQLDGIVQMIQTGRPTWPIERTLLTSGILDAALASKTYAGGRIETPHLNVAYQTDWTWQQPPDPPPGRPIKGQ